MAIMTPSNVRKDPHPANAPSTQTAPKSLALAFPILSGRTAQLRRTLADLMGPRREEFEASQLRIGILRDLRWIQSTPQGDFGVRYFEAAQPLEAVQGRQQSAHPFDAWLRNEIRVCAAFDPYDLAGKGRLIVDVDTGEVAPTTAVAFAVPTIPGKERVNLEWAEQFRLDNPPFADMIRRATVVRERVWQYETPMGAFSVLFMEAKQPAKAFETWATGQGPFERLLRTKILEIHGVDLSKPAPPPELVLAWDLAVTRAAR
jgi:hypothetical protein